MQLEQTNLPIEYSSIDEYSIDVNFIHSKGIELLEKTYKDLNRNSFVEEPLQKLWLGLYSLKNAFMKLDSNSWYDFINTCTNHPLRELLHLDPLTKRAFCKPRGYPGDAVMLDYLYYGIPLAPKCSKLGEAIFEFSRMTPISAAIRERSRIIGHEIDNIVQKQPLNTVRVLSIACGHLREMNNSKSMRENSLEIVAYDQDEESLKTVHKDYSVFGVKTIHGNVIDIIKKDNNSLEKFDFIYAAGLFDYLPDATAEQLVNSMFKLSKPGGKIYITNVLDSCIEQGYMETFGLWSLIYRNRIEIESLARGLDQDRIAGKKYFEDMYKRVGFLEIDKVASL